MHINSRRHLDVCSIEIRARWNYTDFNFYTLGGMIVSGVAAVPRRPLSPGKRSIDIRWRGPGARSGGNASLGSRTMGAYVTGYHSHPVFPFRRVNSRPLLLLRVVNCGESLHPERPYVNRTVLPRARSLVLEYCVLHPASGTKTLESSQI